MLQRLHPLHEPIELVLGLRVVRSEVAGSHPRCAQRISGEQALLHEISRKLATRTRRPRRRARALADAFVFVGDGAEAVASAAASGAAGPPPPFTSVSLLGSERGHRRRARKLVIRHIPPKLTEEQFAEATARWASQIKWRRYEPGQAAASKSDIATLATAYLEFAHTAAAIDFSRAVDGAPVTDSDGTTCRVQVEFALCQKVPEASPAKVDARAGTIEDDDEYKAFVEGLGAEREKMPSAQVWLEEREAKRKAGRSAAARRRWWCRRSSRRSTGSTPANLKRDRRCASASSSCSAKQAKLLAQREAPGPRRCSSSSKKE